ncbi:hypothetical protein EBR96_04545 [bacterium]|nr:hypothetical protein [bacterium]
MLTPTNLLSNNITRRKFRPFWTTWEQTGSERRHATSKAILQNPLMRPNSAVLNRLSPETRDAVKVIFDRLRKKIRR